MDKPPSGGQILAFAHYLEKIFRQRGNQQVEVRAQAHASLNGRRSQPLIDPNVDLSQIDEGFSPKKWILPFSNEPPR